MTETSELHAQEYKSIKQKADSGPKPLVGARKARVGGGGTYPELDRAKEGAVAQFPSGSPAHAATGGRSPPAVEVAGEDHVREGDVIEFIADD